MQIRLTKFSRFLNSERCIEQSVLCIFSLLPPGLSEKFLFLSEKLENSKVRKKARADQLPARGRGGAPPPHPHEAPGARGDHRSPLRGTSWRTQVGMVGRRYRQASNSSISAVLIFSFFSCEKEHFR